MLVLDRRVSGFHGDWWEPQHDLSKSDRHLVVPHVCSSAHASQSVRPIAPPAPVAVRADGYPF